MLKLVNAGLGRTGTSSLRTALERLGFGPCYDMSEIIGDETRLTQWERIVGDRRRPDWKAVFDGYAAATGGPCAIYYRQIVQAFPDAKVILTVRDADQWYADTYDTFYQFALKGGDVDPEASTEIRERNVRLSRLTDVMTWKGLFGGRFYDKAYAIEVFRDRNHGIVRNIDPGNLLVYEVTQGWEPLCAFLGVDVPPDDFPDIDAYL